MRDHARGRLPLRGRQRGASFFGWVAAIAIGIAALTFAFKTVPHYLNQRQIVAIVESVGVEDLRRKSKSELFKMIDKRLKINNVRELTAKDVLSIERTTHSTKVLIDYETRENLFSNIDVVVVFEQELVY
ncbi:MAG: DUF4845 domain-containing protein [Pseudomonadota bacterium]